MRRKNTANSLWNLEVPEEPPERSTIASHPSDKETIDPTPVNATTSELTRLTGTNVHGLSAPVAKVEVHRGKGAIVDAMDGCPPKKFGARGTGGAATRYAKRCINDELCKSMGVMPEDMPDLPCDAEGNVVMSDELMETLCMFLSIGGMLITFAKATGVPRSKLMAWTRTPKWRDAIAQARSEGYDALAEETIEIATKPMFIEESVVSYGADGGIMRRDVRHMDAVSARQLAVKTRVDLLKRWAPDRYGDRVEVKTDGTLASRILAARSRVFNSEDDKA